MGIKGHNCTGLNPNCIIFWNCGDDHLNDGKTGMTLCMKFHGSCLAHSKSSINVRLHLLHLSFLIWSQKTLGQVLMLPLYSSQAHGRCSVDTY